jgi:D-beta-D-heptose 7-phosphate kinase/D-beta-D-heptose 1-phosphate adenosyltransferase
MPSNALTDQLSRLKSVRVLCIGDLMLDCYVYGDVSRVSPEAPIPVLKVARRSAMLGGAGNVARNITALGASVMFIAVVGDDSAGRDLAAMLGAEPAVAPSLLVEAGRPSTIKTRYIANAQQLLRADSETERPINDQSAAEVVRLAAGAMASCDAMLLSDYAKGVLAPDTVARLIAIAKDAGKPVVIDPKGGDFARFRGATAITPNRREAAAASGLPDDPSDGAAAAMGAALIERFGVEAAVITRGDRGMSLITPEAEPQHLPADAREVYDVSGAGDTVAALFALSLGAGLAISDAAKLANLAASVVVGKVGTAVVYEGDLLRADQADAGSPAEAKVMALSGIVDAVERWRRDSLRIGFTNGCFDLLHPGHIALLEQARGACDRLIVGLNSDTSTSRLKGDGRPIQPEQARAHVLASLACVDAVVIFEEDTPLAVIEATRPDLLIKGADYSRDQVVGGDFVESYGGSILLAAIADGYSTTGTVEKLRQKK